MGSSPRLRVSEAVAALIRGLHPDLRRKVRAALDAIVADPACGKTLRAELDGFRSYRLARMRIIYRISPRGVVELVTLGPRSTIYEETLRLVARDQSLTDKPTR